MPHVHRKALSLACALIAPSLFQPASAEVSENDPRVIATDCMLVGDILKNGASGADKKKLKAASDYFSDRIDGTQGDLSREELVKARKGQMDTEIKSMGRKAFREEFNDLYWQGCYAMVPKRLRPAD